MAIGVWVINVGFLIQGRSRLLPSIAEQMGHIYFVSRQVLRRWVMDLSCFRSLHLSHPVAPREQLCIGASPDLMCPSRLSEE